MRHTHILIALTLLAAGTAQAQTNPGHAVLPTATGGSDFGTDFTLGVEKKITRGLSVEVEGNFRTQDNSSKPERIVAGAGLSYRLMQTHDKKFNIKANAGFEYIWKYNGRSVDDHYNSEGRQNGYNVTAKHWRNRRRISAGLSFNYSPSKRWSFQLKETFQFNYFMGKDSVQRAKVRWQTASSGDYTLVTLTTKDYARKHKDMLRNKFTTKYNVKGLPLTPYASIDLGVGIGSDVLKQKYTVGADYKVNKKHTFNVFYRYQTENDDDEPNGHLVGAGYNFKF